MEKKARESRRESSFISEKLCLDYADYTVLLSLTIIKIYLSEFMTITFFCLSPLIRTGTIEKKKKQNISFFPFVRYIARKCNDDNNNKVDICLCYPENETIDIYII